MSQSEKISTLRIVYDIEGRAEAAYVSEFFKLCGILVTEQDVLGTEAHYEELMKDVSEYDFNLFLGISLIDAMGNSIESGGKCMSLAYSPTFEDDFQKRRQEMLHAELFRVVGSVLNYYGIALQNFIRLYVNEEYCRLCYLKRFFSKEMEKKELETVKEQFLTIIFGIEKILNVADYGQINSYLLYARLFCAKKVNELCDALQIKFYYQPELLIGKCLDIAEIEPRFASAYMLAATLCACDRALYASVIPFYDRAIRILESKPSVAKIYYKLGQYLEKKKGNVVQAYMVYERAAKTENQYFRAVFKVACKFLNEKKFTSAIEGYKEVIRILESKYYAKRLLPVEIEYLCKCYLLIGLIHDYYWNDEINGSGYYKKAIDIVENDLNESLFFELFFEKEANRCRKFLEQRISLREHILVHKYK